ncbi:MAG: ABC transporter ATP-binding protein [Puniceicoccales bacterium]|nr:ABC transporter ATP-binding protein [Puniceicoccales bacterium]
MLLQFQNVSLRYPSPAEDVTVFNGINFSLNAGESCAIMGQSGCGKTSFLHLAGGLLSPSAGEISWSEHGSDRVKNGKELQRGKWFGFVLQQPTLMDSMNVFENVLFPWRVVGDGLSLAAAKGRAEELLEAVGLLARRDATPSQLSGGECQRIAIARALLMRPRIVIADEPTGNLDFKNANAVAELLFSLCRNGKSSLLLATHSRELAQHADRSAVIENGKFT